MVIHAVFYMDNRRIFSSSSSVSTTVEAAGKRRYRNIVVDGDERNGHERARKMKKMNTDTSV